MPATENSVGGLLSPLRDSVVSSSVWRNVLWVAAVGVVLSVLVAGWLWNRGTRQADALLEDHGGVVAGSVVEAVDEVVERLTGVAAFFQGSEMVTQSEFRLFVANFDQMPGMGGIGYMPIVSGEDLSEYEARVAETIPGYSVFEFDDEGNRVPVQPRSVHVPVQWFEPSDAFNRPHGFDTASSPARSSALNTARITKDAAVTPFLQPVSEEEMDGFLIYRPVIDPDTKSVVGYTFAPMDLSDLLDGQIPAALTEAATWRVDDLGTGSLPEPIPERAWTTTLDVGGRSWRLAVVPTESSPFIADRAEPLLVFLVGLAASVLAATGVYLYRRKTDTQRELQRLKDLTRAKDEFLASVSHQLRTPLTGVLGFAEILKEPGIDLSENERRTVISNVADEAADLAAIIDDLVVAARSELDLLAVTRVPVSLKAQTAQVLEAIDQAACARVEIVGDAENGYRAAGDPGRVRQIIRNLVTNACRYGGERIQIRFTEKGGLIHLDVADDGEGLPSDEWERSFEPYYRFHTDPTQPAALGIGLTVARHLAKLMEGDITYRRVEGWTTFRLSLPLAEETQQHQRANSSMSTISS